jgi:hypothetical protein
MEARRALRAKDEFTKREERDLEFFDEEIPALERAHEQKNHLSRAMIRLLDNVTPRELCEYMQAKRVASKAKRIKPGPERRTHPTGTTAHTYDEWLAHCWNDAKEATKYWDESTPVEAGDVGALDDDLAKLEDMVGEVKRIMKRAEGPSDETALGAMNPSPKQPNILRFGIDSGACATVIPADWHTEYATEDVGNAKSYRAASGDFVKDEGLSKLHVDTMSDRFRTVKVRRAKVTKPLMAVSSILDAGGSVTFTPQRSWITDARGHEENLERRQNVFNLAVKVRAPSPPK